MDFRQATEALKNGNPIRRKSWPNFFHIKMIKTTVTYIAGQPLSHDPEDKIQGYRQETIPFIYDNNIILSEDWVVVGEENVKIPFSLAIEKLQKRHKVRLAEWDVTVFIEVNESGKDLIMRRMCTYEYVPSFECFSAHDWEIF